MRWQPETPARVTLSLVLACLLPALSAYGQGIRPGGGIWKAVVPPVKMKGAFDNDDPIGLVAGKRIPADCSINWTDPDTHKLYCFASATSLVYFLDAPQTYLTEAEKSWRTLQGKPADSR